jgi:hypothetical protein
MPALQVFKEFAYANPFKPSRGDMQVQKKAQIDKNNTHLTFDTPLEVTDHCTYCVDATHQSTLGLAWSGPRTGNVVMGQ